MKTLGRHGFQAAGTVPRSLALDIKQLAVLVEANAAGTAKTAGERGRLAVGGDFHDEAAIPGMRIIGLGQTERDELIASGVKLRPESVFVVVRVAPIIRNRFKAIGPAVAIRVADPRQLTALRHAERVVFP